MKHNDFLHRCSVWVNIFQKDSKNDLSHPEKYLSLGILNFANLGIPLQNKGLELPSLASGLARSQVDICPCGSYPTFPWIIASPFMCFPGKTYPIQQNIYPWEYSDLLT